MKINGLLMDDRDNVVTCVAEIHKGEQVVYKKTDGKNRWKPWKTFPSATKSL